MNDQENRPSAKALLEGALRSLVSNADDFTVWERIRAALALAVLTKEMTEEEEDRIRNLIMP